MFKNKDKVMARVADMPRGEFSPSNHYWCVTCKMLFDIEKPVCPYMPKICLNNPIPVEVIQPETTASLEKFGLFYPKIPQKVMAFLVKDNLDTIGENWALAYKEFLDEWHFPYHNEPLQMLKSFIIMTSGCETAQRVRNDAVTFIITDAGKIWEKDNLFAIMKAGTSVLANSVSFKQKIDFDTIDIVGDMESGKYYCPMCKKFFEFSLQRDTITCPLMAQKCMATPRHIDQAKYSLMDLMTVYEHTPDIYRRFITLLSNREQAKSFLRNLLEQQWKFELESEPMTAIEKRLGIV